MPKHRILFICLGNICRSPMAEGIFRNLVEDSGAGDQFHIDSAGLGAWHVGDPPDSRGQETLRRHGIDISGQQARQVTIEDFNDFDLLIAMDCSNREALQALAPAGMAHKVRLFLEFAENARVVEVPDPYYGSDGGFEGVRDLITQASQGLLADLTSDG